LTKVSTVGRPQVGPISNAGPTLRRSKRTAETRQAKRQRQKQSFVSFDSSQLIPLHCLSHLHNVAFLRRTE